MSQALDTIRDRFESTPRELDADELVRLARGDRGCLGDLVSGLGAIMLVGGAILGAMELVSFDLAYAGCAIWIGGFVWGTYSQTVSGRARKAALTAGPLVMAVVLRKAAWLGRPGKRVGRALVLFSTDPRRRFDRDWLDAAAAALERAHARGQAGAWAELLRDEEAFGMHALDELELDEPARARSLWLAAMIVHPERLEGGYLGYAEDQDAGERDAELDAELRAPTVLAIVEPETKFIEQVPRS